MPPPWMIVGLCGSNCRRVFLFRKMGLCYPFTKLLLSAASFIGDTEASFKIFCLQFYQVADNTPAADKPAAESRGPGFLFFGF